MPLHSTNQSSPAPHFAFLRGMNIGGRRLTNEALCGHFSALGCRQVAAFLASGNVSFDPPEPPPENLQAHLEEGLQRLLGYPVPTFLRGARELRAIADHTPFDAGTLATTAGKIQVALLSGVPSAKAEEQVRSLASADDRLALAGRELYWLPKVGISTSELDFKALERALGPTTVRTHRTIQRMAKKYL